MELPAANRSADGSTASQTAFLAGWLIPQLTVLGLCASRIGLWAKAPPANELFALPMMLAVQIAAAAVLLPKMSRMCNAAIALAAAWPLAFIAATLGAAPVVAAARGEIAVSLWILAIAVASFAAQLWRGVATAWALAIFWAIGGGFLYYLRLEFSPTLPTLASFFAGPLVSTICIATRNANLSFFPLLSPTAISLLFFGFATARRARSMKK
jgi:hypothetical protein